MSKPELVLTRSDEPTPAEAYSENLKIAAYAATGGRKTLQIGHLIEAFGADKVGIISCEHGLGTIASVVKRDQVTEANSMAELRAAWMWAKQRYTDTDTWVCVDGGSRVLQWIRDDVFGNTQRAYEQMLEGVKPTDLHPSIRPYAAYITGRNEVNTQAMWVRIGMEADRLLNSFVKLPSSMYWTFWEEQTSIDAYSKGLPWKPDTPGKGTLDALKGTFDFIVRLIKDGDSTTAQCCDTSKVYYAKHRDDWRAGIRVPDEIKDFRLDDFVMRLRGKGF